MKHKPMLLAKAASSKQNVGREVIGLIGTHHGVGVTYTGLMLAFYMGEDLGKKTAYLECNQHHDMTLIYKAYEWTTKEDDSFSFHQVTCIKEVSKERLPQILADDYECIIIDFGTNFDANREEFMRCYRKIIVGGRSEWDLQKLTQFADNKKTIRGSDTWLYFIPQANNKRIRKIRNEGVKRVYAVPVISEPTFPSHIISRFFGTVL